MSTRLCSHSYKAFNVAVVKPNKRQQAGDNSRHSLSWRHRPVQGGCPAELLVSHIDKIQFRRGMENAVNSESSTESRHAVTSPDGWL